MYAIVNIAGQQFKVEKDKKIIVNRLSIDEGATVEFEEVLLIEDDNKIDVGKPYVKNAKVVTEVIKHLRGPKVLVFKKKRRKGYQKLNGHRQDLTQILIKDIVIN